MTLIMTITLTLTNTMTMIRSWTWSWPKRLLKIVFESSYWYICKISYIHLSHQKELWSWPQTALLAYQSFGGEPARDFPIQILHFADFLSLLFWYRAAVGWLHITAEVSAGEENDCLLFCFFAALTAPYLPLLSQSVSDRHFRILTQRVTLETWDLSDKKTKITVWYCDVRAVLHSWNVFSFQYCVFFFFIFSGRTKS